METTEQNPTKEAWLEKLKLKSDKQKKSKKRGYIHFDSRIKNPLNFVNLISCPTRIEKHAFLPFIRFEKRKFKYKKDKTTGKRILIKRDLNGKRKVREIMYAGHLDTLIYVWYQSLLEKAYENFLKQENLTENIIAYRNTGSKTDGGGKCNIDFANEIFSEIRAYSKECVALTFDIENFFPSLSHELLYTRWAEILGIKKLPSDQLNVFKSLTKYSYIDLTERDARKILKFRTRGQIVHTSSLSSGKKFNSIKFREIKSEIRAIETATGKKIFCTNYNRKGIPQGSPLSGLLANIYMTEFDRDIKKVVEGLGGIYKRYSDDIIVVLPQKKCRDVEEYLRSRISRECDKQCKPFLEIKEEKTSRILFTQETKRLIAWKIDKNYEIKSRKSLQYLGFEFDGRNVFIRAGSIAKYYNKVKFRVKKLKNQYERGPLLRRKLFSRFTLLGKKNFFSYVKKSEKTVANNRFSRQLRKSWPFIREATKEIKKG